MALGDVIGRPLVNPLEGLGAGVQAGFEIAQGQEKLRLANEELALNKQKLNNDFLEKGMNAIANISKSKGSGKSFYTKLAIKYMQMGGLEIDESQLENPDTPDNLSQFLTYVHKAYPGTTSEDFDQKRALLQQYFKNDPEAQKPYIDGLEAQQKAILAQQTFGAQSAEIAKREAVKKVVSTNYPGWMKQQMMANPTEALPLVSQFDPVLQGLEQTKENLKRSDLVSPQKRRDLTRRMNEGLAAIQSPDTFNQGVMMLQGVNEEASGLVSEAAQAKQAEITKRSQLAQQGIERRFQMNIEEQRGREVDKKVDSLTTGVNKIYTETATVLRNLESKVGTPSDPKEPSVNDIKTAVASFARTIQAERGALSNADVSRVLATSLNFDIKKIQAYIFGDAKAPAGLVAQLRNSLATFKENLVKAQIKKVTDEMKMEKRNPRTGKFFKSNGYARQQLREFANGLLKSSEIKKAPLKDALSLKDFANDRMKKNLPVTEEIIDSYEEQMLNQGFQVLP